MRSRPPVPPLAAAVLAGLLAVALAACAPAVSGDDRDGAAPRPGVTGSAPTAGSTTAPVEEATPGASRTPGSTGPVDCGGASLTIADDDRVDTITGDCPYVVLAGADVELDADDARIGSLEIAGDRADVEAGVVDTLTVAGQENEVEADTIGSVVINGDRNDVEAGTRADSVAVNGNDNEVTARELGAVLDQGQGNTVRADD